MALSGSLISELESAIQDGSHTKRVETLRQITDLFLADNDRFNEEQIALFDDVLLCLMKQVEDRALAQLSTRVSHLENAPVQVIQSLARNDEIAVAGPVLAHSPVLQSSDLIEIASAKSQAHLLAISARSQLDTGVTDVLIDRGNAEVVGRLVENRGAEFSDQGFATLTQRAESNQTLMERLGKRPDLPIELFRRLLKKASDTVKTRLLATLPPERQREIERILNRATNEVDREAGIGQERDEAERDVDALIRRGKLNGMALGEFARQNKYEHLRAGLAALLSLPADVVDRVAQSQRGDAWLILFKAADLGVMTVLAIIQMPSFPAGASAADLDNIRNEYAKLSPATAQRVLRFWKVRETAAG